MIRQWPCWCLWGRATRLREGEEIAEEGAEEGEGDENEAESLFGAVDGKSVVMASKRRDQFLKDEPCPFD